MLELTDLGREKSEELLGKSYFLCLGRMNGLMIAGLSDEQIEQKLTGLVKESS